MKVQGMVDPGSFTVERIPGSGRSLVRLFQNVTPVQTEDFTGYEYDEYHVEVETWDGIAANVRENYETFLRKGMDNEIDRSNRALYSAQVDTDAMNVDQEFRLTLLELGLPGAGYLRKGKTAMLYRTLKRMIERGQTEGIETKLDIFYAADKISESEYQELLGMPSPKA